MTYAIETTHLTKTYGKRRGIEDINLQIQAGEIFGFLGPNGAGKSTTLRTLTGFMKPTSGSCAILGIDPHQQPVEAMAKIGNLPTEFAFGDRMTGRQLIQLFARLRGIDDVAYADVLAKQIDADLDRPMRRLSRGNKQKIGIVQAMFHRPPVVILDEPTGGLDPLVQDIFLHLLDEGRKNGQTILFSSHVLSEIERVADRVGIIRDGRLAAVEDPHDLTERAIRHVHIRFRDDVPTDLVSTLKSMPNVSNLNVDAGSLRLTLNDDAPAFLQVIADAPIASIDIERPTLEEIFLTFYGANGKEVEA